MFGGGTYILNIIVYEEGPPLPMKLRERYMLCMFGGVESGNAFHHKHLQHDCTCLVGVGHGNINIHGNIFDTDVQDFAFLEGKVMGVELYMGWLPLVVS